jgi:hypothetical protein
MQTILASWVTGTWAFATDDIILYIHNSIEIYQKNKNEEHEQGRRDELKQKLNCRYFYRNNTVLSFTTNTYSVLGQMYSVLYDTYYKSTDRTAGLNP